MARVVAVFDDLLLGSNVLGMLRGHDARLTGSADVDPDGVDVLIVDVGWVGGVTEALEVAAAAQAAGRQLALHDCSGPLVFAASVALASHLPGVDVQEFTRSYYHGWWPEIVDGLPDVADGRVRPAAGPGFGIRLRDHVLTDAKTRIVGTGACVPVGSSTA